jgi:ABC-type uncharacterized transport system substrate-binding protein
MWQTVQRLSLGLSLIVLASAILLFSESPRQKSVRSRDSGANAEKPMPKVAMFQMASQPIIDDGAEGVLKALADAGFVEGTTLKLTRFNAEGDIATANAIAQELVGGGYDLVITLTTSALQAMANANKQGKVRHVFGLVSDPIKAGVGIGTEPFDHPAHLVGIGTFPPVADALQMARQVNPKLQRIGLAWNPAEVNSEVCTLQAREKCRELKIELLEANVENTSAVKEAVSSLIDRQAEALLVGGDVTMLGAMDAVVKSGNNAHIPVFTCMPGNAKRGALFDVGANYYEVGRAVGRLAARVLEGDPIAKLPVEIAIPPKLFINRLAAKDLRDNWSFPRAILDRADSFIDETGQHDKPQQTSAARSPEPPIAEPPGKVWRLRLLSYVNTPDTEDAERGLRDGLKKAGLIDSRDFDFKAANAQGDMSALNGMAESAIADQADLILTISTQALQSAVHRARATPIVFTMVANPFAAGVATTEAKHLPNVTGAYGSNDAAAMMPIIRQLMPNARRIGALFAPGEVNSVYQHKLVEDAAKTAGFELISLGMNSPTEAPDVAQSLCAQGVDLICLPNSNLAGSSFPTIVQPANRAKIPVFGFLGAVANHGAVVVLTRDYYDMALDAGQIAARVIRGEKPADIPLHQSRKNNLVVNLTAARTCGLSLPESLVKSADRVIDK